MVFINPFLHALHYDEIFFLVNQSDYYEYRLSNLDAKAASFLI